MELLFLIKLLKKVIPSLETLRLLLFLLRFIMMNMFSDMLEQDPECENMDGEPTCVMRLKLIVMRLKHTELLNFTARHLVSVKIIVLKKQKMNPKLFYKNILVKYK